MGFVDNSIGWLAREGRLRCCARGPLGRIGLGKIYNHSPVTLDGHGTHIGVYGFANISSDVCTINVCELVLVTSNRRGPGALFCLGHFDLGSGAGDERRKGNQFHRGGSWCPDSEVCFGWAISVSQVVTRVGVGVCKCFAIHDCSNCYRCFSIGRVIHRVGQRNIDAC